MALFWVQQFYTLPVIFEGLAMGDVPPLRQSLASNEHQDNPRGSLS